MALVLADSYVSAVLAEGMKLRRCQAEPASGDLEADIKAAVEGFAPELRKLGAKLTSVSVVTNAVMKAIVGAKELEPVALFRLSSPEGHSSPTLLEPSIAKDFLAHFFVLKGGHGFDGRIIGSPDVNEVQACYNKTRGSAETFVVSSPFSILFPDHEKDAANELSRCGAKQLWLSSEVSSMPSILDRETTAILCAATSKIIENLEANLKCVIADYGCNPALYFGRNDGSIIGSELARRFPLETAWGIEGHSASGASRVCGFRRQIVVAESGDRTWMAGAQNGRPVMRSISYLKNMLVHVAGPVIADFSSSASDEVKNTTFELISELVGTKSALISGLSKETSSLLPAKRTANSPHLAAINAAMSVINWERMICVPKGSDMSKAEKHIRSRVIREMKQAGAKAKTVKLDRLIQRLGVNLPEGAVTLTLKATGMPT